MSVRVSAKRKKDGQIRLIARATAGDSGGALEYVWFDASDGKVLGNDDTYVTTDAVGQTRTHQVNVVVTEKTTGSTGVRSYGYTSKKTNDGSSRGPTPSTGGGGSNGTNGGSGGGNGVNGVFPQGNSVNPGTTTTPTPTPPNQTFTPPPTEPTAPTTTPDVPVQSDVDTSAITNVAQNISGNGDLQTVSGVLLSSPTVAPAAGGGGSPIAQLPAPVATELSSVFQPVDDPGDIWPYLITILFGTCLAGAVREWVNP